MRCGNRNIFKPTKNGERVERSYSWYHLEDNPHTDAVPAEDLEGAITCDGTVTATIVAEDEPYFGGSSATLNISYVCDKCGNRFFPQLPDSSEALSKFVTDIIAGIDDAPLKLARREEDARREALSEAMRQRAQELREARKK